MTIMGGQKYDFERLNGFYSAPPEDLVVIGIDTPHDHRGSDANGHQLWDSRILKDLNPEDVANVVEFGITEVVTIYKFDGKPTVWKGRTRVRWARAANKIRAKRGLDPILVPVRDLTLDEERMWDVSRSENAVRVATDPITIAGDMADMKAAGKSAKKIALIHSCSESQVHERLQLLTLHKSVKNAIASGEISLATALTFLKLSHEKQVERLALLRRVAGGKKITTDLARASSKSAESSGRLSPAQIAKLCESEHLSPEVLAVCRVFAGKVSARAVPGMTAALREIGFGE